MNSAVDNKAVSLIALDWGSSNMRASLLGAQGDVVLHRTSASGMLSVQDGRFEEALRSLCGDWLDQFSCPVIASGMVGSRQGWIEVPYIECPATIAVAASKMGRVQLSNARYLHVVPGVSCIGPDGQPDVMRGEETQIWGADLDSGSCCVLPGTHSKWAWLGEDGVIERFQTYMTGELYAVLLKHSILGRMMQPGGPRPDAFSKGAQLGLAEPAHLLHTLFSARTNGLMAKLDAEELPEFLSGMLIGAEVASARLKGTPKEVTLLGDGTLCERYSTVLDMVGVIPRRAAHDVTQKGLWRVAGQANIRELIS